MVWLLKTRAETVGFIGGNMENIYLNYPVHTLEGECVLPAGQSLSHEVIGQLIAGGSRPASRKLLSFGTVLRDLDSFLRSPPYSTIFDDPQQLDALLGRLSTVEIIDPVLESLEYFKEQDFHTYRHILMVFLLSSFLAGLLVVEQDAWTQETVVGPAHDFGKICIPLGVLTKRTALTQDERQRLKHHPLAGYVLLAYYYGDANHLAPRVARDHHEKRDGSGYPRGITDIDPMVEIVAVSDVYDALISPRPYRLESYDNRTALEYLTQMAEDGKFSWEPVRGLVAQNRIDKPDFRTFPLSLEKRGVEPAGNLYGVTAKSSG